MSRYSTNEKGALVYIEAMKSGSNNDDDNQTADCPPAYCSTPHQAAPVG
jgi:hypothetical protein